MMMKGLMLILRTEPLPRLNDVGEKRESNEKS